MQIDDLVRIVKAKVKDAGAEYLPAGFFENLERIHLRLENTKPFSSDEYAKFIDNFWLSLRQKVDYLKKNLEVISEIREEYRDDANFTLLLTDYQTSLQSVLNEQEKICGAVGEYREKYYSLQRGEISPLEFTQFVSSLKPEVSSVKGKEMQNEY